MRIHIYAHKSFKQFLSPFINVYIKRIYSFIIPYVEFKLLFSATGQLRTATYPSFESQLNSQVKSNSVAIQDVSYFLPDRFMHLELWLCKILRHPSYLCFPANSLEICIEKLIRVLTFFSCSGNQNQKWRMRTPVAGSDLFDDEDSIVVGKFVCIYSHF